MFEKTEEGKSNHKVATKHTDDVHAAFEAAGEYMELSGSTFDRTFSMGFVIDDGDMLVSVKEKNVLTNPTK